MSIILYHCPKTRASVARWMLEEVGAPYAIEHVDVCRGGGRDPEFLKINPMGKVPAIRDGAVVVAKNAAIALYLADAYPQAGLAPPIGDLMRGPYLTWMVWGRGCLEPAMTRRSAPLDLLRPRSGEDPEMLAEVLASQLRAGPWLLGERFSAADVIVGATLMEGLDSGAFPQRPELMGYQGRLRARPAAQRVEELEAAAA